jgi:hypothetical protein
MVQDPTSPNGILLVWDTTGVGHDRIFLWVSRV